MNKELLDLYTDYLISSFGTTTATGLSTLLDGRVSHDQITRMLAGKKQGSAELWQLIKPQVRRMQSDEGVMIIDDSIEEKPYTDENDIVCWHYDHSKDRLVKGINFVTALYSSQGMSLPVGVTLIAKTEPYVDKKDGKTKRRSPVTKNEHARQILRQAVVNQIPFKYVLNDVWFASAENMRFITQDLQKDFVMPLKANRKVALSLDDKRQGKYVRVDTLGFEDNAPKQVYLEGVPFPLLLVKQVFINEDGSTGVLYLVTSDTTLTFADITTIYQKRWNVERYHQSLKQNASLAKSPTQTVVTQTNHFFAALCAFVKLELLKSTTKLNHFALKAKLYVAALHTAFTHLRQLQPVSFAA
jgi:DDE superfamily endonuclease